MTNTRSRSTAAAAIRQSDRAAALMFLVATAAMLAGAWWMTDGRESIATPAGVISTQR